MKKTLATILVLAMVASLVGVMFVSADATNLALNKKVTGADVQTVQPKYSAALTDGNAMAEINYEEGNWFGYWYNADAEDVATKTNTDNGIGKAVIDLGEACTIDSIRTNAFLGNASGILPPKSISYEVSADGETYTQVFKKEFENPAEGDKTVAWVEAELETPAVARYVRVNVENGSSWAFINEVEVYGTVGAPSSGDNSDVPVDDGKIDAPTYKDTYKVTESTNDKGEVVRTASVDVPYGYTWNIASIDGVIAGEDATICTTQDAYNACNPNWAITIYAEKQENGNYVALQDAIVTPGSAEKAGITIGENQIAIVIHSASSDPEGTHANWMGKIVAVSVKAGDEFEVNTEAKTVYAVIPRIDPIQIVTEEIAIDGALEDTGYTKATWFNKGVWQSIDSESAVAPVLKDIDAAYTVRTDADNVYLAVKVTDEVVFKTALDPANYSQAGATNFRIWMSGDGMFAKNEDGTVKTDDAGNNVRARTFYDIMWDGEKFLTFREKVATEELTIAADTANGTIELEVKVAKSALNITDSFDLMVTYSAPDFGEGDNVGYNAYHMTSFVRGEDGALPKDWSQNLSLYENYTCEATVLGTYEVDVTPVDPIAEYKKELEALVGEDNENADFDLVLKSEATKDGKVVVTVTVENIKEGANLQGVFAKITYDDTKLKLITEKNSDGSLAFGNITVPSDKWENVSSVVTEEVVAEDGTKSIVDTNVIDFNFTNADDESAISADTPFAVTIEFELLENCTYGGVYAASASVTSLGLETQGDKTVFVDYIGNGSYTVAELPVDEPVSSEPPAKPGDTGVIVFAVLGVIAIVGAAVVIKARH